MDMDLDRDGTNIICTHVRTCKKSNIVFEKHVKKGFECIDIYSCTSCKKNLKKRII